MVTSDSKSTGIVPVLVTFPARKVLTIDNNDFTLLDQVHHEELLFTSGLKQLSVSRNQLKGSPPASVANSWYIQVPILSNNWQLPELIFYSANFISYEFGAHTVVGFSDIGLFGDTVDVLVDAPQHLPVTWLAMHLQNNQFTESMSRLTTLNQTSWYEGLVFLDLSVNSLRWSASVSMHNPLSDRLHNFPESLQKFHVKFDDFSGIFLPAALPSVYRKSSIHFLNLVNNCLSGRILDARFSGERMPHLQRMDVWDGLSNNKLTGRIPPEIGLSGHLSGHLSSRDGLGNHVSHGNLGWILPPSHPLSHPRNSSYTPVFDFDQTRPRLNVGQLGCKYETGVPWWVFCVTVGASTISILSICLAVAWPRWRVYRRRRQQDAELIQTLLEGPLATLMSLREVKKATSNFAEIPVVEEGGFGKIYRGTLNDGTVVAVKRSTWEGSKQEKERFLNEVRILTQLSHRNLVKLLNCCMENTVAVLVFEFVSNGTLQDHLRRKCGVEPLTWKQRLRIAVQVADALNYLHSAAMVPIYHRDVNSGNVLLTNDLNAKVADFRVSKIDPVNDFSQLPTTVVQGTFGYMDPAYFASLKFTDRSDVYSFGVVHLELMSARPAIDVHRPDEERSLVFFATRCLESGALEKLVDPSLMHTYLDQGGDGRDSILGVGRLAAKCSNMRSKARPCMHNVWQELRSLSQLLEPEEASLQLESFDAAIESPQHSNDDLNINASESNSSDFSSSVMYSIGTEEMSCRDIEIGHPSKYS